MPAYITIAIIAYLIGSVNFSVIFSKKFAGFDVRDKGSGNAGSTNMLRTVGKKAAALTLICDILKGVVSILLARLIAWIWQDLDSSLLLQIAGIFVVLGHTFPIFFRFRGGKGVATSLGVVLSTNWQVGLICLVFALILMALTQTVSIGSIMAAILYPVLMVFLGIEEGANALPIIVGSILLAVIVVFNHRENVKRILAGKENKISFKSVR